MFGAHFFNNTAYSIPFMIYCRPKERSAMIYGTEYRTTFTVKSSHDLEERNRGYPYSGFGIIPPNDRNDSFMRSPAPYPHLKDIWIIFSVIGQKSS